MAAQTGMDALSEPKANAATASDTNAMPITSMKAPRTCKEIPSKI